MKIIVPILVLSLLAACTNDANNKVPNADSAFAQVSNSPDTDQPAATAANPADTVHANQQVGSSINLRFDRDSSSLTADGQLTKDIPRVIAYLPVDRNTTLTATLMPADSMNLRFSQLVMPDSTMDGPLGQKFNYDLNQKGVYQFIIAPNNMADGARTGSFKIRMSVKKP